MRYSSLASFCAGLLLLTSGVFAAAEKIPLEAFAALPVMDNIQLSPDAKYYAYIGAIEGRRNLIIRPLGGKGKPEAIPPVEDTDIGWFRWINNERLLVSFRYTNNWSDATYTRTALFSVHRSKPGYINMARQPKKQDRNPYAGRRPPQLRDKVVDFLPDDPTSFLLSIDSDFDGRDEIRKVNVETGRFSNITKGYDWIRNWVVDQDHKYRLGWGYSPEGFRMLFIDPDSNRHKEINDVAWYKDDGIDPIAFTADPHITYATAPNDKGMRSLVTFNIPTGTIVDTLFEHETVDVGNLARDPKTRAVIGVYYTDRLPRVKYFDPELAALKAQIDGALPNGSNYFTTFNREQGLYVISHNSPLGRTYYALDLRSSNLSPMAGTHNLPTAQLAPTETHTLTMRDGLKIRAFLTRPDVTDGVKLPLIVMPHGGPHARDDLQYDYWAQFLANRGYVVLKPNFRGSTGYGVHFKALGKNQWGGKMQDDVTDATLWAAKLNFIDPSRICIIGGSYGGYAALMGVIREPDLYKCAVSINGVTDLADAKDRFEHLFSREKYAETLGTKGKKIGAVSPFHRANDINAATLLIHAKDDPVVPFEHSQKLYKRMKKYKKKVSLATIRSGDHYLDTTKARLKMLTELEKFLAKQLN